MQAPIPGIPLPAASGQLGAPRDMVYRGFSIRNTHATVVAVVRLWAGTAPGGSPNTTPVLDEISLAVGESARELYGQGLRASGGIYFELVAGTVEGTVRAY